MEIELMSVADVARVLKLTPQTVQRMARRGQLPARKVGRTPTRMQTVEAYARKRLDGGARASDPLLVNQYGERISASGIRNWGRRVFGRAVRAVELEEAVPYLLRHSRAAPLLAAGYPNGECAYQLGHTLATFMRVYASVIEDAEPQSISSLEDEVARARKAVRSGAAGRAALGGDASRR